MKRVEQAHKLIDEAMTLYKTKVVYALFSGGHDSLTATHITSLHPAFKGVIHIDTCTGIRETKQFVIETCEENKWTLYIQQPATRYEQLIVRHGFPGPANHAQMYRFLKERPLEALKKELKKQHGGPILFATGVRKNESLIRMGRVEPYHKDRSIWVAPIYDWTKLDCSAYIAGNQLPRNPVSDALHLSGECGCGSFARMNEKKEIGIWYPTQHERIQKWQTLVKTAVDLGLASIPFNHQEWGHGRGVSDAQTDFFDLCTDCLSGGANRE